MTLKEIAEELQVSPSTISRVLNGCSKNFTVKPEVRNRILARVEECGYKPNRIFSALRSKDNSQISFLFYNRALFRGVNTVSDAVDAIAIELPKLGYKFNFLPCESIQNLYYPMPEWKTAGLIIPDVIYPRQLKFIEAGAVPYVVVNGVCGKSGSAVLSDESANIEMVMAYLYELGHRRIGYLDGYVPGNHHYSYDERKQGYLDFCRERNLAVLQNELWHDLPLDQQLAGLLAQRISAVVCYSDEEARQVLFYAWRNGIVIPRDLSVITFNEIPSHAVSIPPLDALAVPGREMGIAAARLMAEKLADPQNDVGNSVRIAGKLVHRESVMPFDGAAK